jgi:gamma-glutamyltranspeptidase/glutathione hydrolase
MIALLLLLVGLAAPQGAVASSEEQASAAAAGILERGGNAVDAAIALHFALAVTYPAAGNLGGGGFFLYRAPDGAAYFLDFRETAPAAAHRNLYRDAEGRVLEEASLTGWLAVAVPGAVPGMAEAHRRWASLPWPELLQPAIALARNGFVLDEDEERGLASSAKDLAQDPRARAVFFDKSGRRTLRRGEICRQPDLAATLELIAEEGEAALRRGALVEQIIAASRAAGGILSAEDFEGARPVLRPVQRFVWRGREILTASPPSSAGLFLPQTLLVLEGWPLAEWGRQDPRTILIVAEASAAAFADRNRWLGDPAGLAPEVASLTSDSYLNARRAALDPARYTPPAAGAELEESKQTTHFSVTDGWGAAVACTTTLNNSYGARVMAPGGFLLNNEMDDFAVAPGAANLYGLVQGEANAIHPGRRPLSSMAPVIVVAEGRVDAVLGSPGGPTILSTVMHVLLNRYVFGMSAAASVAAPRGHRQDLPPYLRYERGFLTDAAAARLTELGQLLKQVDGIGDVNAIFRNPDGSGWTAVADPRNSGAALLTGPVSASARK